MLLTKTVVIKWHNKTKKHYVDLGYPFTKFKDEFKVKVEDLSKGSHVEVEVECDYCGEKIKKKYKDYINQNIKSIINKDCCDNCKSLKIQESNLLIYGCKSALQVEEIKEKMKTTNLKKYGYENVSQVKVFREKIKETSLKNWGTESPLQNDIIKENIKQTNLKLYGKEYYTQTEEYLEKVKITNNNKYGCDWVIQSKDVRTKSKITCNEKYGYDNPFQVNEFKEKIKKTCLEKYGTEYSLQNNGIKEMAKQTNILKYGYENPMQNEIIKAKSRNTLYNNGTAPKSNQQIYLHNLLCGELNYPVGGCSLDIAFPDEKIYIEYDGGGHDLSVKLGNETEEQFNKRNKNRWYYLRRQNWREIRIISKNDYIPFDNKILDIFRYAKEYLNTGHTWIRFDINNQLVKCSQFEKEYDFGKLRKVYKNNIINL